MRGRCLWVLLAILFAASVCRAAEVPADLAEWRGWVLHGMEDQVCPPAWNNQGDHHCYWPSRMDLDLTEKGGRFSLDVTIFAPSWVSLPGGPRIWPQNVRVGDRQAGLSLHRGRPALFLEKGRHILTGDFTWTKMPESIPVPTDSGLVALTMEGRKVLFPNLRSGLLWLREKDTREESTEDTLNLQVFRHLEDSVPFTVVTRLELDVAGRQREVLIGPALLFQADGEPFIPVRLTSPLTARLENDGRLRIQVRPGHWRVEIQSRSAGPVEKLQAPALTEPWPSREIWVFAVRTDLRVVEAGGLSPVDPRQTTLPPDWHDLPAFLALPGQELSFQVIRRGDTDPAPDRITIGREMWLDFNGKGYTVLDRINGTMSRTHRLEGSAELKIGRVTLSGEDMLITRLEGSDRAGVEVRRGELDLVAASRMEGTVGRFPPSGWDHDFVSSRALLNIPPGWEVVAVTGVDNRPRTWLGQWTLLDLFLVLIISIASFKMLGRWTGILALAALALTWHGPFAPNSIWLQVLIASALVRYLPEGRLKQISQWYRFAALSVLIFLFIPFAVCQMRAALYPQLEQRGLFSPVSGGTTGAFQRDIVTTTADEVGTPGMDAGAAKSLSRAEVPGPPLVKKPGPREGMTLFNLPSSAVLQQIDKEALVQTGPGVPSWKWKTLLLQFNGPVSRDQRVRIFYLPPFATSVVRIAGVLLVALLGLLMAGLRLPFPKMKNPAMAALPVVFIAAILLPGRAGAAQFPPPELLKEYQTRLLEPPKCMPDCAQVSRMRLQAGPDTLRLVLEIHALAEVAVPLPGMEAQWLPDTILVDGVRPQGLSRSGNGILWTILGPGVHQVAMEGRLPGRSTVQLPLPLPVHLVTSSVEGWILEGVHENGVPDRQLQLTRIKREEAAGAFLASPAAAETLPPFVLLERTLTLGLEWRSRTVVRRVSPPGTAVVLEVPLLEGESVITEGVRVQEGKVLVNMGPNQQVLIWDGALPIVQELTLTAPRTDRWVESWQAEVSPIWHMDQTGGIPVVARQDPRGVWSPSWRPWPGEEVRLSITRPKAVPGSTLTIDGSSYELVPGKNATDAVLTFSARSSLGGQHVIGLPSEAELTGIRINGLMQPIRPEEGKLILPVHPGTQDYEVSWRLPEGIGTLYSSPKTDLGQESANQRLRVNMPRNRWILLAGGPRLGPAVLFWSVIAVILLFSFGLARTGLTPLRWWQWTLLGLGLTQVPVLFSAVIVGWLLALGLRARMPEDMDARRFDAVQAGLAFLSVLAALALVSAVKKGLLGYPEMQVIGNGSTAYNLLWYADRVTGLTARVWVLSVPMFFYRLLMLVWALWLASSLIRWLKWGWGSFTKGGYWKKLRNLGSGRKKETDQFEVVDH